MNASCSSRARSQSSRERVARRDTSPAASSPDSPSRMPRWHRDSVCRRRIGCTNLQELDELRGGLREEVRRRDEYPVESLRAVGEPDHDAANALRVVRRLGVAAPNPEAADHGHALSRLEQVVLRAEIGARPMPTLSDDQSHRQGYHAELDQDRRLHPGSGDARIYDGVHYRNSSPKSAPQWASRSASSRPPRFLVRPASAQREMCRRPCRSLGPPIAASPRARRLRPRRPRRRTLPRTAPAAAPTAAPRACGPPASATDA